MPSNRKPDVCFETNNTKSFTFSNNAYVLKLNEIRDKTLFRCTSRNASPGTILTIDSDRNSDKAFATYAVLNDITNIENITIAPADGVNLIWIDGDGTLETGKNYIIQFRQIGRTTVLASLTNTTLSSKGETEQQFKYGVLLTLSLTGTGTTSIEKTVTYNPNGIDPSKVKLYWNYNPETDELGQAGENTHTYRVYPDSERIYHLLVLSNENLYFPNRNYIPETEYQDILNYVTIIDKYKDTECLLFPAETTRQSFQEAKKLQYITDAAAAEIIDKNVSNFYPSFANCESLKEIPAKLFEINGRRISSLNDTFAYCKSLTSIPDGLFNYIKCYNFVETFYNCTNIEFVPADLFDICTPYGSKNVMFAWCFYNCNSITGNVPELWNKEYTPPPEYWQYAFGGCFGGCTNAANYSSIPDNWR